MKFRTAILFAILFLGYTSASQTKFNVQIEFPFSIDLKTVTVSYHDGLKYRDVFVDTLNHTVRVNGNSNLSYPIILITSGSEGNSDKVFKNYVILKKNAKITFANRSDFSEDKLLNAVSMLDFGESRFNEYAKTELDSIKNYLLWNGAYLNDSVAIYNKYYDLLSNLKKRKWDFVKSDQSFYSLWMFKDDFIYDTNYDKDTLLNVYASHFASRFSKTPEAKQIISALNERQSTFVGKQAPLFISHDYNGRKIDLSKFIGEKYVILNFWATWCEPCMAEMPVIDSIFRMYSGKGVEIISISLDRNFEKCKQVIQKQQMNWTNIINDPRVEKAYGDPNGIPQVYLVDKTGKIIYSKSESDDGDLQKLLLVIREL
ncbi:TlpA disulfide reductase family protein [Pollutibacter soli]|uniref:TlpA family protein disulfide reductase n=1 Tax=Pollutibacter soli TaxID=3034157 RepID=UPI0030141D48